MGCIGCTVSTKNGTPKGCGSKGNCSTGGCNRLNTYDWLSALDITDTDPFDIVEVNFKNGARKGFYKLREHVRVVTGDFVVVETGNGFDVGKVSLSGELVRLQLKKKKVNEEDVIHEVVRRANDRDLERLQEARDMEVATMVKARVIARTLGLEMKIGDVEYQGDKRKATFYYTADGRVDFRELIRHYAKEFRVKIEMRQIGARQESARIGGIGSCGRELCCSTWLTDFKSVSTVAARYQNLAINQAKLSGQCGRLKCCLNYELDTYLDALDSFPENADKLYTLTGTATLIKTDIFKKIMYYVLPIERDRDRVFALELERVKKVIELNIKGEKPEKLEGEAIVHIEDLEEVIDFEDGTGDIELPAERRKKKKKRSNKKKQGGNNQNRGAGNKKPQDQKGRSGNQGPKKGGTASNNNSSSRNANSRNKKPQNNSNEGGGENKPNSNRNKSRRFKKKKKE